jgi:hypothetical protein
MLTDKIINRRDIIAALHLNRLLPSFDHSADFCARLNFGRASGYDPVLFLA